MSNPDPTTPDGLRFIISPEAKPVPEGEKEPCVWCNHDEIIGQRKEDIADYAGVAASDVPDYEAMRMSDYQFTIGHGEGEGVVVPVCEGCLHGLPVEWGDSTAKDLPYRWEDEVVMRLSVENQDGTPYHRPISVRKFHDRDTDLL